MDIYKNKNSQKPVYNKWCCYKHAINIKKFDKYILI